jgi:glycosyltransferase involved in cell wall biosynthesis
LLDAIARLRERRGETLSIVCSGRLSEHARIIRAHARRLRLEGSLHLLGFVSPDELRALYAMARCVVIPTLFEAASFPLWEAFQSGVPAACSNVTALPEQAGDAAVVFDPRDPDAMAEAVWRVWTDVPLRERLISRGRERVRQFTWERTARTFRAHYRRICNRPLSGEDRALLEAPVGSDNGALQHAPLAANSDLPRSS